MVAAVSPSCGVQFSAHGLISRSGPALADEKGVLTLSRSVISRGFHEDLNRNKAVGQLKCAHIHFQQTERISPVVLLGDSIADQGVRLTQGALLNRRRLPVRPRATESNLTVERPGVQKQKDERQLRQSGTKKEIYKGLEDSPSKVERCVIVDEDNNVVGEASRADTVGNRLWGRGVYCLVQNTRGQLLVTQRTEDKDLYPGHLDVVVSGCVNVGEEYSDTVERELSEELGLKTVDRSSLAPLFVFKWVDEYCRIWGCGYHYVTDCETFDLQVEEVQWCKWMDLDDVEKLIQTARFTPVGLFVLRRFLRERQVAQA